MSCGIFSVIRSTVYILVLDVFSGLCQILLERIILKFVDCEASKTFADLSGAMARALLALDSQVLLLQ